VCPTDRNVSTVLLLAAPTVLGFLTGGVCPDKKTFKVGSQSCRRSAKTKTVDTSYQSARSNHRQVEHHCFRYQPDSLINVTAGWQTVNRID